MHLKVGCNNTGGMVFQMSIPSGASHLTVVAGMGSTTSSIASSVISSTTPTGSAFNTVNFANGWVRVTGTVVGGANGGNVKLQFRSNVDTQVSTVYANSYLNARKIS
jgi:hypothetical protein